MGGILQALEMIVSAWVVAALCVYLPVKCFELCSRAKRQLARRAALSVYPDPEVNILRRANSQLSLRNDDLTRENRELVRRLTGTSYR